MRAQGNAACTGSYCTTISPATMNLFIHTAILAKTSRRTIAFLVPPLDTVHCLSIHSCLLLSTDMRISLMLTEGLRSTQALSFSLSLEAASAQRSLSGERFN